MRAPAALLALASVVCLLAAAACSRAETPLLAPGTVDPRPDKAAWAGLPRLPVERGVIFRGQAGVSGYNIHNYLDHDGRQFVVMWTSSPINEGEAGSRVMRSVSGDGVTWAPASFITPLPPAGQRYFARGFWRRGGQTMALVSVDREGDFFGPDLQMLAFEARGPVDQPWALLGVMSANTITNFSPQKLPDGAWLESSRDSGMRLGFIKGGVSAWNAWSAISVPPPAARWELRDWPATAAGRRPPGEAWKSWLRLPLPTRVQPVLDEPVWWTLPDGRLMALYRDNTGRRVYQSIGSADGERWTRPRRTNFPDASSKLAGQRLSNGLYVLVSNPRPQVRDRSPLVLSVSRDGQTFTAMGILIDAPTSRRIFGQRKTSGYQYPQLLEHAGRLYVAYSRNKEDIELLSLPLRAIEDLAAAPARKP